MKDIKKKKTFYKVNHYLEEKNLTFTFFISLEVKVTVP